MSQADRIFKKAFQRHFTNHEANFPLSQNIRLGDYGVMQNGYFVKKGNLKSHGIKLKEIVDDSPTNEEFQSSNQISVKSTAKGDLTAAGIPALKASLEISFNKEAAVYFSSANVLYNELDNLAGIGKQIVELYKNGNWEKRQVIVTKLITAKKAIVVISGSGNSGVTIEADAPAVERINLTDLKVNLQFSKSDKVSYKILANDECQLGFGLSRIYNPIFNGPGFKNKSNNLHLFASLDEDKSIDANNLIFGDIIPAAYV